MLPVPPMDNVPYCLVGYAELPRDIRHAPSGLAELEHLNHGSLCQFRCVVGRTACCFLRMQSGSVTISPRKALRMKSRSVPVSHGSSSLQDTIGDIVSLCSQEQVVRPNADLVVAFVAHHQPIMDRAIGERPRKSMCSHGHPSKRGLSVAVLRAGKLPFPAPIARHLLYVRPEKSFRCDRLMPQSAHDACALSSIRMGSVRIKAIERLQLAALATTLFGEYRVQRRISNPGSARLGWLQPRRAVFVCGR